MRNQISSFASLMFLGVLLVYPSLQRRIQIGLWHLWNGDTSRLQEYDIPVPSNWIAHQTENGTISLLEVGSARKHDTFRSMIFISKGLAPKDMDLATSLNEQSILSQGAQIIDRQNIIFDMDKADCIVSNASTNGLSVPDDIITITCESTANLSIRFNGDKANADTFLSVVSHIRKHNE